jgi:Nucleotidyl transferase AbiEii toxin, Type IV TA system
MIVCGALERVRTLNGRAMFVIKGGVTIELRLKQQARATKDLDAILQGEQKDLLHHLDEAFKDDLEGFTLRRDGEPENIGKATRINVKLLYKGKSWGTVPLEVSIAEMSPLQAERVAAIDLAVFGLTGPTSIECLPLNWQIAQKLHALTLPPKKQANARFRDAADLELLRGDVKDLRTLRLACETTFELRATHSWPPAVETPADWQEPFARLAAELGLDTPDIEVVASRIQEFIQRIAAA